MKLVLRIFFGLAALLCAFWAREVHAVIREEKRMEGMIGKQGQSEPDVVTHPNWVDLEPDANITFLKHESTSVYDDVAHVAYLRNRWGGRL